MTTVFASTTNAQTSLHSAAPIAIQTPYTELAQELNGRLDFEDLPVAPEPGHSYDQILAGPGVQIGEHLSGQAVHTIDGIDALSGTPNLPLRLIPGASGKNLAVAYHAGFGSNAVFPLGPKGFADIAGRGEGAMTLVFAHDIARFGLKLHADYADPLGNRPPPGTITLRFYAADGRLVTTAKLQLEHGIVPYGFILPQSARAVTLTHQDPGGIAVDDILYPLPALNS